SARSRRAGAPISPSGTPTRSTSRATRSAASAASRRSWADSWFTAAEPAVRTKIVATVGPATAERDKIHALAEMGVDVVRINFAHGTHDTHERVIAWTREAAAAAGKPMAVLADLAGPKIRIGALPAPVPLEEEQVVVIAPEAEATGDELPTTYDGLALDVYRGARILLDDGL